MNSITLGIVGYGEVGKIFAKGLQGKAGIDGMCAWDLNFQPGAIADAERARADAQGVRPTQGMAELCEQATLIMSAVTASNTLAVAEEAARHLRPGTVFLDLNSASPGTKQQAAKAIESAGGRYVEAGVMTSVPPYGIAVPMLLGGSHAETLAQTLTDWGMNARAVAPEIGVASAIKMCRSIMIKGMEALVIESYATARRYGVEVTRAADAGRNLPADRLGEHRRVLLQPGGAARQAPRRGNARIGAHRAGGRLPADHGQRHCGET